MKTNVLIIGAGISGLALGWFLKKRFDNISLTILEKSNRPGGLIKTHHKEGFLFEEGPRSCRSKGHGAATLELAEALGLQSDVIAASHVSQKRYLYINGRLQPIPKKFLSFVLSPLTRKLLVGLCKEWSVPPGNQSDESIYDFVARRLDPEIAESLFDPLVLGIYAGDIRQLSLKACFPKMFHAEQHHGSLVKGWLNELFNRKPKVISSPFVKLMQKAPLFTFRNGMETLVKKLAESLNEQIKLECPVQKIHFSNDQVIAKANNDQSFAADHLFLAVPAIEAGKMLESLNPALSQEMASIPTCSVAVINMGWKSSILNYQGFGYLVPTKEKEDILGLVWDSSAFPDQNQGVGTRITAMAGGVHHPGLFSLKESEILQLAEKSILKHLRIRDLPDEVHIKLAKDAIPQYVLGHCEKIRKIEDELQESSMGRISLIGNSWYEISVNDCIARAQKKAEKFSLEKINAC